MVLDFQNSFQGLNLVDSYPIIENRYFESLVTFGIPTYKRATSLVESLESILNQHTDYKYNIIVSDNNPTRNDETEVIMKRYSSVVGLRYYKHEKSLSPAENWNKLFLLCPTKYLIMLHDDDVILPDYISKMIDILQKNNVDYIKCSAIRWDGVSQDVGSNIMEKNTIYKYNLLNIFFHFPLAPTGCAMRVDSIMKIGGFNKHFYPAFDYVLVAQLLYKNALVCSCSGKYLKYRVVGNDTSKPETQLLLSKADNQIKLEIGRIIGLPKFVINSVLSLNKWRYDFAKKKKNHESFSLRDYLFLLVNKLYYFTLKSALAPRRMS